MHEHQTVTLKRDCEAIMIPAGHRTIIPEGTEVTITQTLGGSYTVMGPSLMARIAGKDSDALGLEASSGVPVAAEGPLNEQAIWEQMKTCYDPEIPVNIVDLGLIYDCNIEPLPEGGNKVNVKMTLTAPGCGMGPAIASDVEYKVRNVPGVNDVHVEVVWDPPWNQGMMTEAAKLQLGLL
jgi:probable FeS assembly SUF system protein SufT